MTDTSGTKPEPSVTWDESTVKAAAISLEEGTMTSDTAKVRNRLSTISQKYDVNGDGVLDETEQAMRDMDSRDLGYLPNEKVYKILQEQMQTQKSLLNARRLLIFFGAFAFLLALSTLGTAFAAAMLAKDTSTNTANLLVVKGTDNVVATNTHGDVYHVLTLDSASLISSRRLVVSANTTTTKSQQSLIPRTTATAIYAQCGLSQMVNLMRKWNGYPDLMATIALCPYQSMIAKSDQYSYHLNNGRYVIMDCSDASYPNDCVVRGSGFQLDAGRYAGDGDACAYDSDCLSGNCEGAVPANSTAGLCQCPNVVASCTRNFFPMCCNGCNYGNECIANAAGSAYDGSGIDWVCTDGACP